MRRPISGWYMNRILPLIGGLISGNTDAYRYLPDSIRDFLSPDELSNLFLDAGLIDVKAYSLSFGVTYLHEGTLK